MLAVPAMAMQVLWTLTITPVEPSGYSLGEKQIGFVPRPANHHQLKGSLNGRAQESQEVKSMS